MQEWRIFYYCHVQLPSLCVMQFLYCFVPLSTRQICMFDFQNRHFLLARPNTIQFRHFYIFCNVRFLTIDASSMNFTLLQLPLLSDTFTFHLLELVFFSVIFLISTLYTTSLCVHYIHFLLHDNQHLVLNQQAYYHTIIVHTYTHLMTVQTSIMYWDFIDKPFTGHALAFYMNWIYLQLLCTSAVELVVSQQCVYISIRQYVHIYQTVCTYLLDSMYMSIRQYVYVYETVCICL